MVRAATTIAPLLCLGCLKRTTTGGCVVGYRSIAGSSYQARLGVLQFHLPPGTPQTHQQFLEVLLEAEHS